jgi:hypothetical protein
MGCDLYWHFELWIRGIGGGIENTNLKEFYFFIF